LADYPELLHGAVCHMNPLLLARVMRRFMRIEPQHRGKARRGRFPVACSALYSEWMISYKRICEGPAMPVIPGYFRVAGDATGIMGDEDYSAIHAR
jgi:hypothetical protein